MEVGVTIDATAFGRFSQGVFRAVSDGMGNQLLLRGFENAQATYLGEMRREYQMASRGGGRWPDLAPSTKLKRFYKAGGRLPRTKGVSRKDRLATIAALPFPILYDSGTLYTSLYPGEPGSIFMHSDDSVSAGTEVKYASYHQKGGRRLPQRRILMEPTQRLLSEMAQPIVVGFRSIIEDITGVKLPTGGSSLGRAA